MDQPPVILSDASTPDTVPARWVPIAALGHLERLSALARQHAAEAKPTHVRGSHLPDEVAPTVGPRS